MAATVFALVLPADKAASGEAQTIGGFPGRWVPGVPYLPAALGMTEDDARAVLAQVQTPLEWVELDAETGDATDFFERPGQVASGFQDVAVDREEDARRVATPIANEQGDVLHAGVMPPVSDDATPGWARDSRQRATDLAAGLDPDAAAAERRAFDELDELTAAELRERADEAGIDHKGLKKDDLKAALREHVVEIIEAPDAPADPAAAPDGGEA